MKRSYAIAALALVGVLALTGCRGKAGDAAGGSPARQPVATSSTPKPSVAPQVAASQVTVDLSDVDAMMAELDRQLGEADKSPADAD
jgi:hypothetical protein